MKLLLVVCALHLLPAPVRTSAEPSRAEARAQHQDSGSRAATVAALLAELEAARAARAEGDLALARRRIAATVDRALPLLAAHVEPEHLCLCALGHFAHELGELDVAERLRAALVETSERTLPETHHELQAARLHLALTIKARGDLRGARELERRVVAAWERDLAADHLDLQVARSQLAVTLRHLGELEAARALQEQVLATLERTLPEGHPRLLAARHNLASTVFQLGDLEGARSLQEQVLAEFERTLPDHHASLQAARHNLAATLLLMGRLLEARALQERVLAVLERSLPGEHPDLQTARGHLARTMFLLGDLHGARALQEQALEVLERSFPEDHPHLQIARGSLAGTLRALGDLVGARRLFARVLEVRERTLPEEHPDLQTARLNLATTIAEMGDPGAARAHFERVVATCERTLPEHHPGLQRARGVLAAALASGGDFAGARPLLESVLEAHERALPDEHTDVQNARLNLAVVIAGVAATASSGGAGGQASQAGRARIAGDLARLRDLVVREARTRVRAAHALIASASVRETEQRLGVRVDRPLGAALSFAAGYGVLEPDDALLVEAFALSEATRAAALASSALTRTGVDPVRRRQFDEELRAAGAELASLAQRGATREEYHRVRARREEAERNLLALAREHGRGGSGVFEVGVESLASLLDEDLALVAFRRYARSRLERAEADAAEEGVRFEERARDSLGAFVLRGSADDPRLAFVDLGAWGEVEGAVRAWRGALGVGTVAPDRSGAGDSSGPRGLGIAGSADQDEPVRGAALRRLVWDPLIGALGDARRVVVVLDDALSLVALDALPLEEGAGLVGERWRIETRLALWELLDRSDPLDAGGRLVILGGAAFDAEPVDAGAGEVEVEGGGAPRLALADARPHVEAERPTVAQPGAGSSLLRGSPFEAEFPSLPHTALEVRAIAALRAEAHGDALPARRLEGPRASRAELERWAPSARWLHVATHGWYAPGSVRSWADRDGPSDTLRGQTLRAEAGETVRGMSPMLLCGLAFAGANLPPDPLGRVPGLVTAEELSALDLSACDLAVLSACDTGVGELARAGQGVASLQKALHMAGARSVITSLWKVDDAATAKFFERFYTRLWHEGLPKSEALWRTKLELRAEGHPVRDWAAWVLTGDPN